MVNSCLECIHCLAGEEQYRLASSTGTYGAPDRDGTITQGGYSTHNHWGAGPGKEIAIVGLGGLGHMAVKIAHAMGAEVTVLSQTLKKHDDELMLGADHIHATSEPETFTRWAGSFDVRSQDACHQRNAVTCGDTQSQITEIPSFVSLS